MLLLIFINLKYAVTLKCFLVFQTERGTEALPLQIPHLRFLQHVKEFEKTTDKKTTKPDWGHHPDEQLSQQLLAQKETEVGLPNQSAHLGTKGSQARNGL